MSAQEFNEADYFIAGDTTGYVDPGEYGPAPCGCYMVSLEFDPVGPRLLLIMAPKDGYVKHPHTAADFIGVPA